MEKRLQIFISSTYEDLKEERQAAVQAILRDRHIPAGMELFAAGDEEQFKVIKRWIDESDIFMLILGKRYGSIESISGKSYTQLEYEYAVSIHKPLFAIVMTDEWLVKRIQNNQNINTLVEMKNNAAYELFSTFVKSKMCSFATDIKDIQIYTSSSIRDLQMRYTFYGWIRNTTPNKPTNSIPKADLDLSDDDSENKDSLLPKENYINQKRLLFEWLHKNLEKPSAKTIANLMKSVDSSLSKDNSVRLIIGSGMIKRPFNRFLTITPDEFQVVYTNEAYEDLKKVEAYSVANIGFTTPINDENSSDIIYYNLTNLDISYKQNGSKLIISTRFGPIKTITKNSLYEEFYAALEYRIANSKFTIFESIEVDTLTDFILFEREILPSNKENEEENIIGISGSLNFKGYLCVDQYNEQTDESEMILLSDMKTKEIIMPDEIPNSTHFQDYSSDI